MTEPRREALRALVAARADKGDRWTRDTYQTLVRWLDDPTESPDPELALLEAVAACRGRPQDGFWAVAQHLRHRAPGVSLAARLTLLRRLLDRHITSTAFVERWRALSGADPALRDAELAELAIESPRPPLVGAHQLFLAALRVLPVEALPAPPFHRGEAPPFIGARGYARFCIFLARRLSPTLEPKERPAFEDALAVAAVHAEKKRVPATPALEQATKLKAGSPATVAARAAALEARAASNRPDSAGRAAQTATTKILEATFAREGAAATRALFDALDAELRRLDVLCAFEDHEPAVHRVTRAVLRASDDDDGEPKTTLWLAELEGGAFALLAKPGRRWTLTVGTRDEILATVPDRWFDRAVREAGA
ncbi:MAG: hypothetical protein JNL79_21075 [Myxococcales bacterium]|nr:hypothetical protein [Myxococcales bacterium]